MTTMLDIIGATVIAGMVMIIIFGVTANLNQTLYTSTFSLNVQTSTVSLARTIEYDFYKIGYNVNKTIDTCITYADTNQIHFKTDLLNTGSAVNRIIYRSGTLINWTRNPRDRVFIRRQDNSQINAEVGVTNFNLTYYDINGSKISTPITHKDSLAKIKQIKVKLYIESPEPVLRTDNPTDTLTSYIGVSWEKLIYPRNL